MSRSICFQFGTRHVVASGVPVSARHPNVLRLHVQNHLVARLIQCFYRALPSPLSLYFRSSYPEWTLPDNIILKKEKPNWEEEFATEKQTYQKLQMLQGDVIPVFYGQVNYEDARAILLSDVGGVDMSTAEGALLSDGQVLSEQDFEAMLYQACITMAACGIAHDDLKLDNFRRVERADGTMGIMALDLERVDQVQTVKDEEAMARSVVYMLMDNYRDHIDCMRHDGLLPKEGVK